MVRSGPGRRIGVFGGTFDPPHIGHLVAAVDAQRELDLDVVLLVVASVPWQKVDSRRISPAEDRLALVRAAVEDAPLLQVSDIEIRRGGPSYTADTLAELSRPAKDPRLGRFDEVLRQESRYSLGYCKPWPGFEFGSPLAFGTPGAGGSFGFADPELGLGFCYAMNRMDFYLVSDPRELALREAALACARQA